jgi:hypothetical protein
MNFFVTLCPGGNEKEFQEQYVAPHVLVVLLGARADTDTPDSIPGVGLLTVSVYTMRSPCPASSGLAVIDKPISALLFTEVSTLARTRL